MGSTGVGFIPRASGFSDQSEAGFEVLVFPVLANCGWTKSALSPRNETTVETIKCVGIYIGKSTHSKVAQVQDVVHSQNVVVSKRDHLLFLVPFCNGLLPPPLQGSMYHPTN